MELYASQSHKLGRDAVHAAAEMIIGALHRLNAAEGDGTDTELRRYRVFAVQWRGTPGNPFDPQTPYSHLHAALDGIWTMLAMLDGYPAAEAADIVEQAGEASFDMIGEEDVARRAYEYAVREVEYERAQEAAASSD